MNAPETIPTTVDGVVHFGGVPDHRYTLPTWSWTSRKPAAFFRDPVTGREETIRGFGTLEVLVACLRGFRRTRT